VKLRTPKIAFTGGAGKSPATPTDQLLVESPRWEAACHSPLVADVAARLRPWEVLLAWVPQHNELALAFSGLAETALRSAPAEHVGYVGALASRLREDARFASEWAAQRGGSGPASATPATVALLHWIAQIGEARSYRAQAAALWEWFEIHYLGWTAEVMLRKPASDLRQRFASQFSWDVVHPFRRELNRTLKRSNRDEWVAVRRMFDQLTSLLADWQAERAAFAEPAAPPGPLQPGQEALRAAKPCIAAVQRLVSTTWNFKRPLHEHVPELPEGITAVPESGYVMVLLDGAFYEPTRAEEEGEPPLDELLVAISAGVEALVGPPEHHARWRDASLRNAPVADGTQAWVWAAPTARVVLTSFEHDHHLPALVQAFVIPAYS
jgi:hypothetical protein